MRIIHLNTSKSKGGMELIPVNMVKAQKDSGMDVCFLTVRGNYISEMARSLGIKVHDFATRAGMLCFLYSQGKLKKPIILHVHYPKDLPMAVLIKLLLPNKRAKIVFTKHSASKGRKTDLYHCMLSINVDLFVANSNFLKKNLLEVYGVNEKKVKVIYYGIDTSLFNQMNQNKTTLKRELGLSEESFLFAQIAQYSRNKCPDVFIKAAKVASERMNGTPVSFLLVGPEADKGLKEDLKRLARNVGMRDNIHFMSFQKDIQRVFAGIDCLVLPSKEEAFGIVLLEAMAFGKPCIITKAGGAQEAVVDNETGLHVKPFDVEGLAKAMGFVAINPVVAKKLGKFGKLRVDEFFGIKRCVQEHQSVYEELWGGMHES